MGKDIIYATWSAVSVHESLYQLCLSFRFAHVQQLKSKIIRVTETVWKLDLSRLTLSKKINLLLVNIYTYLWLIVLALHILPFIWDGELYNYHAS